MVEEAWQVLIQTCLDTMTQCIHTVLIVDGIVCFRRNSSWAWTDIAVPASSQTFYCAFHAPWRSTPPGGKFSRRFSWIWNTGTCTMPWVSTSFSLCWRIQNLLCLCVHRPKHLTLRILATLQVSWRWACSFRRTMWRHMYSKYQVPARKRMVQPVSLEQRCIDCTSPR